MSKAKSNTGSSLLDLLLKENIEVITSPEPTEFYPTGSLYLDWLLGGGIPKGRWTNLWGPESWGKTTLALLFCKAAIERGEKVAYVDVECALDPIWASRFGFNLEEAADLSKTDQSFFLIQPSSAERALNGIARMTALRDPQDKAKPAFSLIILDSVAALATEAELAGEIGDQTVAGTARVMAQYFKTNKTRLAESGTAVILVNQERDKFQQGWSGGYGPQVRQPGGRAVQFYSSIILKMAMKPQPIILKQTGEVIGLRLKAKTTKNKVSRPGREVELTVYTDVGESDIFLECAMLGKEFGIFTREDNSPISGGCAWWYRTDQGMRKIAVGQAAVAAALDADRELCAEVENMIRARIANMNRGEPVGTCVMVDDDDDAPPEGSEDFLDAVICEM